MTDTNRPDLSDELRAWRTAAAEEFEAAGFTHEDALSLALQGERFLAEQSREERGKAVRAGRTHIRMSAPVGSRFSKAVRPDGTDFHTGTVRWLPPDGAPIPEGGWVVEHPHPGETGSKSAADYLSASSVPTDCTGFQWPARLLLVEPTGDVWAPHPRKFPRERAAHAWRVVRELPAWQLFGPQGREVTAIIEQAAHLTIDQIAALIAALKWDLDASYDAAWGAAWGAVRGAARGAAWGAVRDADLGAPWVAARDAALGWLVKDLISVEDFRILAGPWEQVVGRVIA